MDDVPIKPYREAMHDAHVAYCRQVMDLAGGKVRVAAELAGVNRPAFYKMLNRAGWYSHRERGKQRGSEEATRRA